MRRPASALLLALALFPVAGRADAPRVVTDVPPVHALAALVMAGVGEPVLLLDRGADPHDVQLRPSQARMLAQADLVFWVGPALTPWLDRALRGLDAQGRAVSLLEAPGTTARAWADGHDHSHDHDRDHGHDHGHDHGAWDPHAWLDPANARAWVEAIAAALAARDPARAATYAANAAAARAEVDAAEAEARALLAPLGDVALFVFHDAYTHFAEAFGVTVAGAIALGDAAAPGAARLAEVRARIAAAGEACVFPEVQHDPRLAAAVVEGTQARLGPPLDPEGSSFEPGPGLYRAMLTGLAAAIAACAAR